MAASGTPPTVIVPPVEYDDPQEEDIHDSQHGASRACLPSSSTAKAAPGEPQLKSQFHERGAAPAHVAPIDDIGRISSIGRPTLPEHLLLRLVGKSINEFGDIIDDDNSTILGQVAGDLPEMVGRRVTTHKGDVLSDDGALLGYINHIGPETDDEGEGEGEPGGGQQGGAPQTLESFTQGGSKTFTVKNDGTIFDGSGNVVGKMNDNKTQWKAKGSPVPGSEPHKNNTPDTKDSGAPPKHNAETFRKENESPSDIFLDVKSTREGIQLVIRIPTVFPGQSGPSIRIS